MTTIDTLLGRDNVAAEIEAGYVRERHHPDGGLAILNYTEKAQYEKHWNSITTTCRGLIYHTQSGHIVARPWSKFFNYGEHDPNSLPSFAPVEVTDKLDGSLGILYRHPGDGRPAIATRGSFTSDQALHATEVFRARYEGIFHGFWGLTYLFEIVYPSNRIVLDYEGLDDLVLLGAVSTVTGMPMGPTDIAGWPGPKAQVFDARNLKDALAVEPRANAEGLVVRFKHDGTMVKIKQEDYVRLHKLVTGLNERAVWEHLSTNDGNLDSLLARIPDEFHDWCRKVADDLHEDFEELQGRAHAAYYAYDAMDEPGIELFWRDRENRAQYAAYMLEHHKDIADLMFGLLDGKDISAAIWKRLKPRGETASLLNRNEDNA
jgi:RNA ligase